jgi:hypothetical protein
MRTLLWGIAVLCATGTVARAQDCTTVAADWTVSLIHYSNGDIYGATWAPAVNYSASHPGCDRFVVDFPGNYNLSSLSMSASLYSRDNPTVCSWTLLKATAWGWVPPIRIKQRLLVPGYWVQLADHAWDAISGGPTTCGGLARFLDISDSQYDLIRVAVTAEQHDSQGAVIKNVGPILVEDIAN